MVEEREEESEWWWVESKISPRGGGERIKRVGVLVGRE